MSTVLQVQARALGDPSRYEIFRYVAEAGRPVDVAELTDWKGCNHNAIRQHLAKLVAAGLVAESRSVRSGRGRPRLLYSLDPAAASRWEVTGPYERLSLLLSEILRTGDSPVDVGRRAAARRRLGGLADPDPLDAMYDEMARAGFEPRIEGVDGEVEVVLGNCPYSTAAIADPDNVCGLHLGMAHGVAARVDGLVVDELVVNDPRRAACRLRVRLDVEEHGDHA